MTLRNCARAILFCTLFLCVAHAQTTAHKVLFALTSGDQADWQLTLANLQNLESGIAPDPLEIEVVVYGPGIAFLQKTDAFAPAIQALEAKHVRFLACGNAMQTRHLTQADLIPGSEIVPAGIVEVVRKQEAGWTYIKAGR